MQGLVYFLKDVEGGWRICGVKNSVIFSFFGVGLILAGAVSCQAEVDKEREEEEGFVSLFDGKSLDGWRKVNGTGSFKVEDGCIVGYGKNVKGNTFLRTEKEYGDFEFRFEFEFVDLTGNSGCMFRAQQKEDPTGKRNGQVFGYQCEHDNKDRSWTAGLYDEARRKWLFPMKKDQDHCAQFTEQGRKIFKKEGWNEVVIRCQGNHIQTWLNGERRVDFRDTDEKHADEKGFFGLQVHGGDSCHVRWRNLRIKPLLKE